tara:strand:- start:301 stop:414 length:114 start_codon:yes stop_codon:yes gene_type:complete
MYQTTAKDSFRNRCIVAIAKNTFINEKGYGKRYNTKR